ncbi:hypothetical protein [uncultured Nostoc sp.]|uniref:hypothetical protein n=1 Tax=uncultured Nostoc sp. TaxID=340711 RepID=UPI0035CB897B
MSVYILAIGGTGAKFAEAVAHAAAVGIFSKDFPPEDLHILFVDPDKGNGNLSAATTTIGIYQKCQTKINGDSSISWMQTKINSWGSLSPFADADIRLRDYFKYDDYNGEKVKIQHLFDVLYTKGERDLYLRDGFLGRPAIGAAVMSLIKNRETWSTLLNRIKEDIDGNRQPKIFLCGSIFGGTGASGFPTLGRLLADELDKDNRLKRVKLGGLLMLPYFQFPHPRNLSKDEISARSEEFILKTKAALDYYGTQNLKFDKIYLLGTPTLTNIDYLGKGSKEQRNQPHFLELFAAGAVRELVFKEDPKKLGILARKNPNFVTWDDVPDRDEVKKNLSNAVRFAFVWISTIEPDLNYARTTRRQQGVAYSLRFFNTQELNDDQEIDKINTIKEWCEQYLIWIGTLHRHAGNNKLELFNIHAFLETNGELKKDRKEFPNLVVGSPGVEINRILTQLDANAIGQPNRGAVGLAKALYQSICKSR